MDDNDTIEIDGTQYTQEQIDRQTRRIYRVVFVDGTYGDDETFGGKLNPDLIKIIQDVIITDQPIEEEILNQMISSIATGFRDWIAENTRAVHPVVIAAFLSDFIPACLEQFFSIEESAPPGGRFDYDPAYG